MGTSSSASRPLPTGTMSFSAALLLAFGIASLACGQGPQVSALQGAGGAFRSSASEAAVRNSIEVLETLATQGDRIPHRLLASSHAVAIFPSMIKGGLVIGLRRGDGVLLIRDDSGAWRPPMFVTLGGGSIGWQAGIQATDLVLVFKNGRAVENLLSGTLTLGVDASVAAGPLGRKAQAATDGRLSAEIYSYSRSRGLFAGVSVDGSKLELDRAAQAEYYAGGVAASAQSLVDRLTRSAQPATSAGAPPGPADPPSLLPALYEAHRRLQPLLDEQWGRYLTLPADPRAATAAASFRETLQRYDRVAQDPRYATLGQRPEFVTTLTSLRRYVTATTARQSPLALPAPPKTAVR